MEIAFLPYKLINKEKWDACVERSVNRLIYGFSFYLDNMAANWDGLVLNDYEAVMPLTWKKKMGIKYLYQPRLLQQGGIFGQLQATTQITQAFLEASAKHFSFAEICLNYANDTTTLQESFTERKRNNYVLKLDAYEKTFKRYDEGYKKNLRRLKKFELVYQASDDYGFVINLFKELYHTRLASFAASDYRNFSSVCEILSRENRVITRIALDKHQQMLAAIMILVDGSRLYNLMSCITTLGKKFTANDFLYDKIIEEFSEQEFLLDFEGSDVKGIADFYSKFNPSFEPYSFVKYNHLPAPLKLFKK